MPADSMRQRQLPHAWAAARMSCHGYSQLFASVLVFLHSPEQNFEPAGHCWQVLLRQYGAVSGHLQVELQPSTVVGHSCRVSTTVGSREHIKQFMNGCQQLGHAAARAGPRRRLPEDHDCVPTKQREVPAACAQAIGTGEWLPYRYLAGVVGAAGRLARVNCGDEVCAAGGQSGQICERSPSKSFCPWAKCMSAAGLHF